MKLHFLRTNLAGETLEKIISLPISNESYDRSWTTLVEYYENQRRIVSSYMAEIFSVKPMKSDTSSEIKRITRETFNPIPSLTSLNRAASLGSDLIVYLTLNRLELNTRKEWERHLGDSVDPPQWSNFKLFFEVKPSLLKPSKLGLNHQLSIYNSKTQSPNSKFRKSEHDNAQSAYSHHVSSKNPKKENVHYEMNLITSIDVNNFLIRQFPSGKSV